tara:strand:+ start:67 stop:576 length:510 start_codon:yes stop_codon:yes gene_type:complete
MREIMKCPECKSSDCAKLSEIVAAGTTDTYANTKSSGIGSMGFTFVDSQKHEMSMTEEAKSAVHVEKKAKKDGTSFLTNVYGIIAFVVATYIALSATNVWGLYDVEWYWDVLIWAVMFVSVLMGLEKIYPAFTKAEAEQGSEALKIRKEARDYEKSWKCRACSHRWIIS